MESSKLHTIFDGEYTINGKFCCGACEANKSRNIIMHFLFSNILVKIWANRADMETSI